MCRVCFLPWMELLSKDYELCGLRVVWCDAGVAVLIPWSENVLLLLQV